jgi:addiction module HigA family antidote
MVPEKRIPTHPGEILLEEFLRPLQLTQVQLAKHLGLPTQRINEIVRLKRGVTPETALLLSRALDTTPEFWLNLQGAYDLAKARLSLAAKKKIGSLRHEHAR